MKNLVKYVAIGITLSVGVAIIQPATNVFAKPVVSYQQQNQKTQLPELHLSPSEVQKANEYINDQLEKGNIYRQPTSRSAIALLTGSFFIPGVGQVILLTTGAIVVGGAVIAGGSWLGRKITNWVQINAIKKEIPSSLKKKNGNVDLGKFKDKHGNTPLNKHSGEFKNGRWSVEKDTAGHGGRKWKIKVGGQRIGSLDENGKVIGK